ncbi:hypothetical protein AYI70_g8360, partial [Smittium culicis]
MDGDTGDGELLGRGLIPLLLTLNFVKSMLDTDDGNGGVGELSL